MDTLRMSTLNNSPFSGARVYVAGHRGMVGSAIVRALRPYNCAEIITRTHAELDLTDQGAVRAFFRDQRPEIVFLAAAKVGGIMANNTKPAEFIAENLAIQDSVIRASHEFGVKRLLFLGSSCIYPRDCPQPIKEEYMLTGPLEPTNRSYALAKLAGIEMCWAFNRQYGTEFLSVMPTNLYGPNDNYDLKNSHVIPALIRKMHDAKEQKASEVVIWGTGKVLREFLHADDMASACLYLMQLPDEIYLPIVRSESTAPLINIGCGEDQSILELADLVREVVGFEGKLVFDTTKPDGTPRKLLDISRIKRLGWAPSIPLREGLAAVYREYAASESAVSARTSA
jgi:GDP-L-fucose synthase